MPSFTANTTLAAADLNQAFNQADLNAQTGTTYTFVLTDQGKLVTLNNAAAVAVTIPLNSSVAFPTNTHISLVNRGAGIVTVAGASGVTLTGSFFTMNQYESATLIKLATNDWIMVRGGGVPKAAVSSSTAAATSAVTIGGYAATVYKFTGTGSITLSRAGLLDVLCQGPGGVGSYGGGGAGGFVTQLNVYAAEGTHVVYVGAGQVYNLQQGNTYSSFFQGVVATGGGSAAQYYDRQPSGGACGGGSGPFAPSPGGVGAYGQGLITVSAGVTRGGNGGWVNGGGGGGVNGDASGGTGGSGYDPGADWGSPGTLGRGGGGASMTANTGNGGNGGSSGNSGLVLIRVFD